MKSTVKVALEQPGPFSVSPNGAHLVASEHNHKGKLSHIDGLSGDVTVLEPVEGQISSMAVADDGRVAIAFDTRAAIDRSSSGEGAPGGSFVEVRDVSGQRLHRVELQEPWAKLSWSPSADAVLITHKQLVAFLELPSGRMKPVQLPSGVTHVDACFCGESLLVAAVDELFTLTREGTLKLVGPFDSTSSVTLLSAGADRALMVSSGKGWKLLDPKGRLVASGEDEAMTGCADGDGVAFARGKTVTRLTASGRRRETMEAKLPLAGLGSGGGRLFGFGRKTVMTLR